MSILAVVKVKGDTTKFRQALSERADEFAQTGERGRAAGALHHRFGVGDGYVIAVDEWPSAEDFEKFFMDPALQDFIASIGADTSAPPEIMITDAVASPDQF